MEGRADGLRPFLFFISVTITSARMKKEDYEPLVKRTLADFDFGTVHKCMKVLDWKWGGVGDESHIPSIGELYQTAERLLMTAAKRAKIPYEWRKRYRSWRKVSKSEGWQEMNELFNQITKTK